MSVHVHVRHTDGLAVTEDGELMETTRCQCGATWTSTFRVEEGDPEG
ncbi:hypothetical protein [Sphaerimonospora mesophila]